MKAEIERIDTYRITMAGKVFNGFKLVGEWNGLLKFQSPAGFLIAIGSNGDVAEITKGASGPVSGEKRILRFDVIRASPALLDFFNAVENEHPHGFDSYDCAGG